MKLKDHRLKPGGVLKDLGVLLVAMKLKDHRLKPGGVLKDSGAVVGSYEIEEPPAKAMWCRSALSD
jgi:hypothetical protein